MDVLYADHCHAPVSEGIPKRHQNTKKQKVVRTNNRSSPISGISDDGSRSLKSGHSNNKHLGREGRYSTHGGGVPRGINFIRRVAGSEFYNGIVTIYNGRIIDNLC